EGDDLASLALGISAGGFPDLANGVGSFRVGLFRHAADEFGLGFLRGHAGQLLQPPALLEQELVQLSFALADNLVAPIEEVELAVQVSLPLLHAALGTIQLLTPLEGLKLPIFAEAHGFLLSGEQRRLPQRFGLAVCIVENAPCRFLGGGTRGSLGGALSSTPLFATDHEKSRGGDEHCYARRGYERELSHWIYAPKRRKRRASGMPTHRVATKLNGGAGPAPA